METPAVSAGYSRSRFNWLFGSNCANMSPSTRHYAGSKECAQTKVFTVVIALGSITKNRASAVVVRQKSVSRPFAWRTVFANSSKHLPPHKKRIFQARPQEGCRERSVFVFFLPKPKKSCFPRIVSSYNRRGHDKKWNLATRSIGKR